MTVVFQDEYLLVIDKPAGLVVTPTQTQHDVTLSEILTRDFNIPLERGGIVHRLDKDTSGLMVIAKTQPVLESLQSQFKDRTIKKTYTTLVHGFLEEEGTIEGAIGRNSQNRQKFIVTPEGKPAATKYLLTQKLHLSDRKIAEIFPDYSKIQLRKLDNSNYQNFSLSNCFPLTGRTHQIRVHLKYINHPIVGDDKYAGRKIERLDHRWCPRQFLHASSLTLIHPQSSQPVTFNSPLPDDLLQALFLLEEVA